MTEIESVEDGNCGANAAEDRTREGKITLKAND